MIKEADAAIIQLSSKKTDGGVEISEEVILHTTKNNEIVAVEILDASKKFPLKNLKLLQNKITSMLHPNFNL